MHRLLDDQGGIEVALDCKAVAACATIFVVSISTVACTPSWDAPSSAVLPAREVEASATTWVERGSSITFFPPFGGSENPPRVRRATWAFPPMPQFRAGLGKRFEARVAWTGLPLPIGGRYGLKYAVIEPISRIPLGLAADLRTTLPFVAARPQEIFAGHGVLRGAQAEVGLIGGVFVGPPSGAHLEFVATGHVGEQFASYRFPFLRVGGAVRACLSSLCVLPEYARRIVPTSPVQNADTVAFSVTWRSTNKRARTPGW